MERLAIEQSADSRSVLSVLAALSFCHCLNDMIQSLIPSIYPLIKESYHLDFAQIGLVTLTFQLTASILQPLIGTATDRRPQPYSLCLGMGLTLVGLALFSVSAAFSTILMAAGLVGTGSSIFHPESSRIARMASGGRHGLAQSIFQVGGNTGSAVGPLLAALIIVPRGQASIAWFTLIALLAIIVLGFVGRWYSTHRIAKARSLARIGHGTVPRRKVIISLTILVSLVFSKHVYMASMSSYYTFYLIEKFHYPSRRHSSTCFCFSGRSPSAPSSVGRSATGSVANT